MLAFCLFLFRSIYSRPTRRATAPHPIRCVSPSCLRESCLNACGTLLETVTSRCCWCTTVVCRCGVGGTHAATSAPLRVPCTWGSGLFVVPPSLRHCWWVRSASKCHPEALANVAAPDRCHEQRRGAAALRIHHWGAVCCGRAWRCGASTEMAVPTPPCIPAIPQLGVMAEMREAWRTWMRVV
ncbi:hypothetical protein B0H14DRAFT_2740291, partial [Mycena olivaceomarginata]